MVKLIRLIRAAKPARGETEILKHREMQKRAAQVAAALEKGTGEGAFIRAKGALKGELPRAEFLPPREEMTAGDINNLVEMIRTSSQRPLTKVVTQDALVKLLGGGIPQRAELVKLEEVFGSELVQALLSKRGLGPRAWDIFLDVVGLPKALVASVDISAPGRQGLMLVSEPGWWTSWQPMLKAMVSGKYASTFEQSIISHPLYNLSQELGLYIAPLGKVAGKVSAREESFMSRFASKIPWVKFSERAYVSFLNKLRSDTFNRYVGEWITSGMDDAVMRAKGEQLASFLNRATGRGNLVGLEKAGELPSLVNAAFFSPRFVMSRFQVPFAVFSRDAQVRKIVARNLIGYVGAGLTALTLYKLAGAEVGLDPRSPDFGKARIGRTRVEIWAGYQPLARYVAQFITGERKAARSGVIYPAGRKELLERFVESKTSPVAGLIVDALRGMNFIGEPMEITGEVVKREVWNRLVSIFVQDMRDAIAEEGMMGVPLALPSAIGGGVVTYRKTPVDFRDDKRSLYAAIDFPGKTWEQLDRAEQQQVIDHHPDLSRLTERVEKEAEERQKKQFRVEFEFMRLGGRLEKTYEENMAHLQNQLDRNDSPSARKLFREKLGDERFALARGWENLRSDPRNAAQVERLEAMKQEKAETGGLPLGEYDYFQYQAMLNSPDLTELGRRLDLSDFYAVRDMRMEAFKAQVGPHRFARVLEIHEAKRNRTPAETEFDRDRETMRPYWDLRDEFPIAMKFTERGQQIWAEYWQAKEDNPVKAQALAQMMGPWLGRYEKWKLGWRVKHPEVESALLNWGYVTSPAIKQLMPAGAR